MRFKRILASTFLTAMIPISAVAETTAKPDDTRPSTSATADFDARLAALNGAQAVTYGPNCWNAALAVSGIASAPRAVTRPEFWHYLNSPLCRRLAPNERPQRGDIGSLFWKAWGNYHSYVHLDGVNVFAKEGPDPGDVYKVQRYEEQFRPNYREMAERCRNLTSQQTLERKDCEVKTVYHRCQVMPQGFVTRFAELRSAAEQYNAFEDVIRPWVLTHDPAQRAAVEKAVVGLGKLIVDLRQRRYSGELEFARKTVEWAAIGLLMSDSFDSFSAEARAAEELADKIQKEERGHIPERP